MDFWKENINKIIALNDKILLTGRGKISNAQMEKMVELVFQKYNSSRKKEEAKQADLKDTEELKALELKIKSGKK